MRIFHLALLVSIAASTGCQAQRGPDGAQPRLTSAQKIAVESSVRNFAFAVAHDVTQEGPAAWRRFFLESPSFFMASEGRLQFASSQAATAAIQGLARTIKHIDLHWGDDLRIDPLTTDLAVVAAPYSEIRMDSEGHQVHEAGYFTGVAQFENGRWQFRNAHWSVLVPPAKVP